MKTININGKEYNKGEFAFTFVNSEVANSPLSLVFDQLVEFSPPLKPSPPKLRPMSESLETGEDADFLLNADGIKWWIKGCFWLNRVEEDDDGHVFHKNNEGAYFIEGGNWELVGYLPAYVLPNPNEIKL